MLELDGRTGEGGGQLVRIATALAALTGQPIRVVNVRGNRRFGGGLKAQHVTAIDWLAAATHATVSGVEKGSRTFTFKPRHVLLPHNTSPDNPIELRAATAAASTSLMLQAVLPYLLFARPWTPPSAAEATAPVSIDLYGGTHVSFAPTYDYLDQVLFPTLEQWFGVRVERDLVQAGWGTGPAHAAAGLVRLVVHPPTGATLVPKVPSLLVDANDSVPVIASIDATVLAPADLLDPLADALAQEVAKCALLSPVSDGAMVDLQFARMEASGHDSRVYVLLVARTAEGGVDGVRFWGRDYLGTETIKRTGAGTVTSKGKKGGKGNKSRTRAPERGETEDSAASGFGMLCGRIARRVVLDLADEVAHGGCGDSYLQDQLVVFQALVAGQTSFWRGEEGYKQDTPKDEDEDNAEKGEHGPVADLQEAVEQLTLHEGEKRETKDEGVADDMTVPFGQGSLHASTARWVTAQVLPSVRWSSNGTVCEGVGWTRGAK
ncbi:RNA 3'-terminal phosphate cyclase [Sporothrix schenckii 1099-18]|uniref:RNA 3'-terminal phosphate cyclase domain-containing protein n=2 Tax=Sporothrix schenckii TaxID=29908 RepID=U7PZ43_SPOS1|nr:RNA 3'-terminal phosphate cyclase [Sporothrix schenckii 1099-18]ERS99989.1 hypothetical protein HMPREF1624_03359 [Sporothrix schenckii ATCC 58251]KJR85588.1 RNA 3'-terminal phosphate cyclase [Sporothrix schenckii 1099-18]